MRHLVRLMLSVSLIAVLAALSVTLRADDEKKQQGDGSKAIAVEEIDVRYHLKVLELYVKELEKAEDADRRTNPKYAADASYLETRRRLMATTVEDFEMGRAKTDDYRRASEELAELELQAVVRNEDRLKASKSHLERMTELAKIVKARMDAGTTGEREMLEGKAAQENAERQLRMIQRPDTRSPAEVTIKQRAAEPLRNIIAKYRRYSRLQRKAAKQRHMQRRDASTTWRKARLEMAKGQPAAAISALKAAAIFADRAGGNAIVVRCRDCKTQRRDCRSEGAGGQFSAVLGSESRIWRS